MRKYEPTSFFNLYTKSPIDSGSESPWRKEDLSILLHVWRRNSMICSTNKSGNFVFVYKELSQDMTKGTLWL